MAMPGGTSGKELTYQGRRLKRCGFNPWVGKIPWRRKWQPTPVFLPRESHGQRSLVGHGPWGHKEPDTTETTSHAYLHLYFIYLWFLSIIAYIVPLRARAILEKKRERGKGKNAQQPKCKL